MGIHNGIHTTDNDHYYYCPIRDCPCHDSYFYDASGNLNHRSNHNNLGTRINYVERTGYYNFADSANLNNGRTDHNN